MCSRQAKLGGIKKEEYIMAEPIRLGLVGVGRAGWGMHCEEIEDKKDMFRIAAACDI